ncbi:aminoglycoside phosphotransferase family protein [Ferrimonas balearica]|uniref:aminoglycoside phosphotransferase family protein n=1 Tax=Ferrimonas balearica TaxID=44012 RepID=UPI001C9852DF|nr:phosphotransferase [Ferrimonas balearica]MBY6225237.1 phosphotransferase [Ferrimonas balearica]
MHNDSRQQALARWLDTVWAGAASDPVLIFGDASFRRYFRYQRDGRNEIAMDAPPALEDCRPFLAMTQAYQHVGLPVPQVLAQDLEQGFLCLSDLGDQHLAGPLKGNDAPHWYRKALAFLPTIATIRDSELGPLPLYDRALLERELAIFPEWLLQAHLDLSLSEQEQTLWQEVCEVLVGNALAQPQVGIHRDFHSRNLMVVGDELALIDYQGALLGPISYDPVSLLRDCYWRIDEAEVEAYARAHFQTLQQAGLLDATVEFSQFQRWMDLMGMQRHLKAAGIFARLHQRDGKSGYLADVPRVLDYLIDIGARYPETQALAQWLATQVKPTWEAACAR